MRREITPTEGALLIVIVILLLLLAHFWRDSVDLRKYCVFDLRDDNSLVLDNLT